MLRWSLIFIMDMSLVYIILIHSAFLLTAIIPLNEAEPISKNDDGIINTKDMKAEMRRRRKHIRANPISLKPPPKDWPQAEMGAGDFFLSADSDATSLSPIQLYQAKLEQEFLKEKKKNIQPEAITEKTETQMSASQFTSSEEVLQTILNPNEFVKHNKRLKTFVNQGTDQVSSGETPKSVNKQASFGKSFTALKAKTGIRKNKGRKPSAFTRTTVKPHKGRKKKVVKKTEPAESVTRKGLKKKAKKLKTDFRSEPLTPKHRKKRVRTFAFAEQKYENYENPKKNEDESYEKKGFSKYSKNFVNRAEETTAEKVSDVVLTTCKTTTTEQSKKESTTENIATTHNIPSATISQKTSSSTTTENIKTEHNIPSTIKSQRIPTTTKTENVKTEHNIPSTTKSQRIPTTTTTENVNTEHTISSTTKSQRIPTTTTTEIVKTEHNIPSTTTSQPSSTSMTTAEYLNTEQTPGSTIAITTEIGTDPMDSEDIPSNISTSLGHTPTEGSPNATLYWPRSGPVTSNYNKIEIRAQRKKVRAEMKKRIEIEELEGSFGDTDSDWTTSEPFSIPIHQVTPRQGLKGLLKQKIVHFIDKILKEFS